MIEGPINVLIAAVVSLYLEAWEVSGRPTTLMLVRSSSFGVPVLV
jgi:hypothetical protein